MALDGEDWSLLLACLLASTSDLAFIDHEQEVKRMMEGYTVTGNTTFARDGSDQVIGRRRMHCQDCSMCGSASACPTTHATVDDT